MRVEIWSDIVCPWCYIGKRRFEAALERFEHADQVELIWRSFELDPHAVPSGDVAGDYAAKLASKYGTSTARAQQMLDNMTDTAAAEGLAFDFSISRPGNTFDAHRLLHLALESGQQDALKEAFDNETFTNGLSVSNHDALADVAVAVGLDEADVKSILTSDLYADAVRQDEAQARAYGISGVPFFVIDGRLGVSGAQPADTLLSALNQAWESHAPLTTITGEGADACSVDGAAAGAC
ncbi:MAG: DsbA family oxidoreductase [Candidatus Nanopelagicales bacterium]